MKLIALLCLILAAVSVIIGFWGMAIVMLINVCAILGCILHDNYYHIK